MRFKLRQMEVFRAVMVTGSINGAARLLFTSQPAISRIVSHTERTLGLALFSRAKGKLVPTPEAEALFIQVDGFYQQALQVEEFAAALSSGGAGTLNIASSPCLSRSILSEAVARFTERYPRIRINIRTTLLNDIAQQILGKKVDLAISVLPLDNPNLAIEPFTTGRMFCVVPEGHPLAETSVVSLRDLHGHRLVMHHESIPFGQLVSAAMQRSGVNMTARIDIFQTDVACALVRAGAGVAIVDEFSLRDNAAGLSVLRLEEEILLSPSIVRSAIAPPHSHADKFVEILRILHPPG